MTGNTLSEYEKGFLEGLIDGEGSLKVDRRYDGKGTVSCVLIISNNYLPLLQKAQKIIGDGSIQPVNQRGHRKDGSPYDAHYELRVYANALRWLLPQLNLMVKEDRRKKMLEILSLIRNGRNRFTEKPRADQILQKAEEFRYLSCSGKSPYFRKQPKP